MWLPATLPSIYVVPSIAVQQTKQGDEHSSLKFARGCVFIRSPTHAHG